MFDCSPDAERWIIYALECLPADVLDEYQNALAFVCMDTSDGRRLTPAFREQRDIIVLSERIVPRGYAVETERRVRYFVFVVLHEIAHAVRQHQPPNEISEHENATQEAEAHALAFQWFNNYIRERNHPDLLEFGEEELTEAQEANQRAMRAALG